MGAVPHAGRSVLAGEALPGGLARHAEGVADPSPGDAACSQPADHLRHRVIHLTTARVDANHLCEEGIVRQPSRSAPTAAGSRRWPAGTTRRSRRRCGRRGRRRAGQPRRRTVHRTSTPGWRFEGRTCVRFYLTSRSLATVWRPCWTSPMAGNQGQWSPRRGHTAARPPRSSRRGGRAAARPHRLGPRAARPDSWSRRCTSGTPEIRSRSVLAAHLRRGPRQKP